MPLRVLTAPESSCPPACCDIESWQVAANLDCSLGLSMLVLDRQLPSELHVVAFVSNTHMLQDGQGPLHVAADLGNTKVVRTLMQLGADKDSRDKVREVPAVSDL